MLDALSKDTLFSICEHLEKSKDIANLRRACKHLNNKIPLYLAESKSPLIDLVQTGKLKALKIKNLTVADARARYNEVLRIACYDGHLEVMQWLTERFGLTIEDARAFDNLALSWACYNGYLAAAQWLTEYFGLTIDDARAGNNYALRLACKNGHLEVAQWLTEYFDLTIADARADNNYALLSACLNGHLEVAQWLSKYFGLTIDDARTDGNSALIWACCNGHLEVVQWLTENFGLTIESNPFSSSLRSERTKGNEHDRKDARANNYCALRYTCEFGHLEVAQWLTEYFGLTIESNPFSSSLRFWSPCSQREESERTKGNEHDRKNARTNNNHALRYACKNG